MPGRGGGSRKDYLHNKSIHNPVLYEELRNEHHMSKRKAAMISNGVLHRGWHTNKHPSGEALGLPDYPDGGDSGGGHKGKRGRGKKQSAGTSGKQHRAGGKRG